MTDTCVYIKDGDGNLRPVQVGSAIVQRYETYRWLTQQGLTLEEIRLLWNEE